jgi:putative Ca2+/H+ antiporter (TMEM165/GDT1 family)
MHTAGLDFGVLVTTFAIIALAELPDKSMVATLILATRSRPLWVWIGTSGAFLVHVGIAVAAGGALALLPHQIVDGVAAGLFALGAYLLLSGRGFGEETVELAEEKPLPPRAAAVITRAFVVTFIGEWGDITQITTANLTARYDAPLSVGIGAALALVAVAGLGVTAGRLILRVAPTVVIRRVAGVALIVLAVISLVAALRAHG